MKEKTGERSSQQAYRYPGSRPFNDTDLDRKLFWGRARESHTLLHLVLAENLVVLFARSGMGKSSLINAGILEPLRERHYLPLTVRVNDPEGPLHSVYKDVEACFHRAGVVLCTIPGGRLESRCELRLDDTLPPRGELSAHCVDHAVPLWLFFKEVEIWRGELLLEPVLVCDQFEELFTLQTADRRAELIEELAALVRDRRVPEAPDGASDEELRGPLLKVVLSLREDYLGSLEELASKIPGILATRFRLEPLTRDQAREAIEGPAALADGEVGSGEFGYAPEAVEAILDFLSRRRQHGRMVPTDEVEPSQLQIVCQHLERLVHKPGHPSLVTLDDLGGKKEKVPEVLGGVLESYYEEQIAQVARGARRRVLRRLCETGLILDGRRTSVDQAILEKSFGVTAEELHRLTDSRLLRAVPRLDSVQYELSHDTLVEPILAVRESRSRRRNRLVVPLVAAAALVVALVGVLKLNEMATTQKILTAATAALGDEDADPVELLILATAAFDRTRARDSEEPSEKDAAFPDRGSDQVEVSGRMRLVLENALKEGREIDREIGGRLDAEPCSCADVAARGRDTWPEVTSTAPEECVAVACTSDGGSRLAVTDRQYGIRIWHDPDQPPQEIQERSGRITVAVDPTGDKIVTVSSDGSLRLWHVRESGGAIPDGPLWRAHPRGRIVVAFSPDGQNLASRGVDRLLQIWDLEDGEPHAWKTLEGFGEDATGVAWSPDGRWLASSARDSATPLLIWNLEGKGERYPLDVAAEDPPFAFDPTSCAGGGACILASVLDDSRVRLWSLDGPEPAPFRDLEADAQVTVLAWSPDGRHLAFGGRSDKRIGVWTKDAGENRWTAEPRVFGRIDGRVLVFHPAGDYLVSADRDVLRGWEVGGSSFAEVSGPLVGGFESAINFSGFTADGMLVASDYRDTVKLLRGDLTSPRESSLEGSHHFLTAVAFSADGLQLLSWGSDGRVRLREWQNGEFDELRPRLIEPDADGDLGIVRVAALGPRGKKLAAGAADGTLRIWNDEGDLIIGPLKGNVGPIKALAFSPDGTALRSRGMDDTVRTWDVTPLPEDMDDDALVSLACKRLEHHPLLTGDLETDLAPEVLDQVRRRCAASS